MSEDQIEKVYGWEVEVEFNNGKPHQKFHFVGSLNTAKRKAMLKSNALHVYPVQSFTKPQWIRCYGDPSIRM
jgi:hypothetical protein